jgi:phosphate uptake regulator
MRELALLKPPYRLALVIFRDSIRAFADGDHQHARTLKLKDRELDALTDDAAEKLVERVSHARTP